VQLNFFYERVDPRRGSVHSNFREASLQSSGRCPPLRTSDYNHGPMVSSIWRRFFTLQNRGNAVTPDLGTDRGSQASSKVLTVTGNPASANGEQLPGRSNLFSFIDLKDPFAASDIAGEDVPGPILSLMNARQFEHVFLFHTPHTRTNAIATEQEISRRHPQCRIRTCELPVSDPKDYSKVIDALSPAIRDLVAQGIKGLNYVCVSSGTAEIRASWFILSALNVLPARLLQVETPLFGQAKVRDIGDFSHLSPGLLGAMTGALLTQVRGASARDAAPRQDTQVPLPPTGEASPRFSKFTQLFGTDAPRPTNAASREQSPAPVSHTPPLQPDEFLEAFDSDKAAPGFDERCVPGLDDALRELGIHVGSAVLRYEAERAGVAAGSPLPVLLLGETGVGKERFAHLIHRLSPRSSRDMVAINCAAIPKELAESHLFGHVKGAYSGAIADKKGIFEAADQSSLFLDEVAELPIETQAKLLRVIQDGSFQRVGSTKPLRVDVRIIAATNRDLEREVAAGRFREDLYFRLEVLQIRLPALRERRNEIPELALALLSQINQRRLRPKQLCKDALLRLERHDWPGNVRELHNVLERSVLYAPKDQISAEDLQIKNGNLVRNPLDPPEVFEGFSLEQYLSRVRKHLIHRALEMSGGNQAEAAKLLGISRQAVNKFLAEQHDNPS
jgi:transcriptional regulator with AAA-type ATPase domain